MRLVKCLLVTLPLFTCLSCHTSKTDLSGFNKETRTAIKEFVKTYKDKENAYVVSDFDNTTVVFDIALQCAIYQLETMSFEIGVNNIKDVLETSIELDSTITNYTDDISSAYSELNKTYGSFTYKGVEDNKLDNLHNDIYWQEFATKMKCLFLYVEDNMDDALACEWIMYWYTGMNEEQVYDLFKRSCTKYQYEETKEVTWSSPDITSKSGQVSCSFVMGVSPTSSVINMLKEYKSAHIDTWICSASHVDGVRGAIDAYKLSDYITGVIGMTQKKEDGKFVPAYDYETGYPYINKGNEKWEKLNTPIKALPSREGKVAAIKNALVSRYGVGPLAGFMDASGDFNFCTEFKSMKMVICYNRANRKITEGAGLVAIAAMYQKENGLDLKSANNNDDTYYLLQGRDENGKRSLRESNKTIRFKEKEEKLFANEDNDKLFNYLKDNKLTLGQYFNKFVIKTNQEESEIGVAYGYLDSYSGYHSVI